MTIQQTHSPLPSPSLFDWLLLLLHRRILIRVTGDSMHPTLSSGDTVFVNPSAYSTSSPQVGEIVVAHHPYQRNLSIIKRIADITDERRLVLHSDNPKAGTDSRSFGTISPNRLIGKVICCVKAET